MKIDLSLGRTTAVWRRSFATSLLLAVAATGCGEGSDLGAEGAIEADEPVAEAESEAEPTAPDVLSQQASGASWCDVQPIMQKSCTGCHDGNGTGGSPMGLTTPADFKKAAPLSSGKTVAQAVSARTHDSARPMPPRGILPAAELAKIDAWIAAGSPAPSAACAGGATQTEAAWPPPECDEVYEFRAKGATASSPYQVPAGSEYHPQIYHDAPWGNQRVQAIGFKPITDNQKVLHHWILYNGMAFLVGWAPGDDSIRPYPKDVGMDMPTGARSLRLDMHYYNSAPGARPEQDRSGVAVCIVKGNKLRPNVAAVSMGLNSFGPVLAPANKRNHESTGTCRVSNRVTILTASPHAHKYATHMRFIANKGGQRIVMHDQPFKFGEQGSYVLDPPVQLGPGDTITTTCVFTNTTSRNITFGESTENEMCFNFAVYYPKGALSCGLLGGSGGLGGLGGLGGR